GCKRGRSERYAGKIRVSADDRLQLQLRPDFEGVVALHPGRIGIEGGPLLEDLRLQLAGGPDILHPADAATSGGAAENGCCCNRAHSGDGGSLAVLEEAGQTELGWVEIQKRGAVAETGVHETGAEVQQDRRSQGAVVVQPHGSGGNESAAVGADRKRQAIRRLRTDIDPALGVDSRPVKRDFVLRTDDLVHLQARNRRVLSTGYVRRKVGGQVGVARAW